MARKAPGRHYRAGISLVELTNMFPNEETAERWFVQQRWPQGVACPRCQSQNIQQRKTRKPQPYRCRDCRKDFSVKTGTLLHNSKLTLQQWAFAIYQMSTSLKGTSSMKLHRDLGITQKSAWHVGHRIRSMWAQTQQLLGPVEVDETYIGGLERNKHAKKKIKEGRGSVGKQAVVGMKSRTSYVVRAKVIAPVSATTLQRFVTGHTKSGTIVYSDQNPGYIGLKRKGYPHQAVNHSVKEYVNGQAHTNGIESFWAMLKRGYYGTYHQMSAKHLPRYINEFAGRHNDRPTDTIEQLSRLVLGMEGKRLPYDTLTNNLDSGCSN